MPNENGTQKELTVVFAGNPNAGKTTLFNTLTGLRQKVANYPGVTVERKTGKWQLDGQQAKLIDLPGLYTLEAISIDEQIARDVIKGELPDVARPDVVVAVVDATNLERNLYIVTQLLEFEVPVVVALTMVDLLEKQGHKIDLEKFSSALGVQAVFVNAKTGTGIDELGKAVQKAASEKRVPLSAQFSGDAEEGNPIFARYKFISNIVQDTVKHSDNDAHRISDKIDAFLTHRIFGPLILLAVLLLIFQTIFSWASLPTDLLDEGFGTLAELVKTTLPEGMLADLISDGIIAGVGGIMVFLPQILLLFLFISILEDSGYMARAAFMMDKLMGGVGLHGKAFLPLISSFACAIPGVMATRTIEDRRDRIATIMIAPLMSCSARLPVYTLMIAAFFSGQYVFGFLSMGAVVMLSMYLLGIVAAIVIAFVLKRTILKAPAPAFIMELPPYRMPSIRTVLQNMFERAWMFVKRAGTVILVLSVILWGLMYFPRDVQPMPERENATAANVAEPVNADTEASEEEVAAASKQLENSYAGRMGKIIEPVIQPLGFDWKIGIALIASFAAREVLVSTLGIIYNVGSEETEESEGLITSIQNERKADGSPVWTPLTAVTLMVFFVLAMQCLSTVAVVRRETNSWNWTLFMVGYMTALAYAASFITFQVGKLLGYS